MSEAQENLFVSDSEKLLLESFLSRCPHTDGGVYTILAAEHDGRLKYLCSGNQSSDRLAFPPTLEEWQKRSDKPDASDAGIEQPMRLEPRSPADNFAVKLPGLPEGGGVLWRALGSSSGPRGLLVLCSDAADDRKTRAEFRAAYDLVDPFFRLWQDNRAYERRYRRLQALEELSLSVGASLDLQEVLASTHNAVASALGFDRSAIYILDDSGRMLLGAWGTDSSGAQAAIPERVVELANNDSPIARVARGEMDSYLAGRDGADSVAGRADSSAQDRTEAVVPLKASGGIVGVIVLERGPASHMVGSEQIRALLPFAAHAGAAVHNARMHEILTDHLNRAEEMEQQRKHFEREVILSVTEGKLSLCEGGEIPPLLGEMLVQVPLQSAADVAKCRQLSVQAALDAGLSTDRRADFELCLGEAATNCYQHAGGGTVEVFRKGDRIQFRILDSGPGIKPFLLPRATLLKGYSTTTSLGMGFSLMLSLSDRLYLSTSIHFGTDMLIEMALRQTSEIERIWEQFGFGSDQAA